MITRCLVCGYDLRATLVETGCTCPECGRHFSPSDIVEMNRVPDVRGMPRRLSPHELRPEGKGVLAAIIAIVLGLMMLIWVMLRILPGA